MKKTIAVLLVLAMFVSLCVLCGCNKQAEKVKVTIFQQKIEIDESLKEMAEVYMKSHSGVEIEITSNGNDYATSLKTKFTSGTGPVIFQTNGYNDMAVWSDYLEDLSNEAWVPYMTDVAKDTSSLDGKVYGFPLAMECTGIVYNKDAYAAAGITELPKTLSEYKQVCQALKDTGNYADGVIANEFTTFYQAGMFIFSMGIAMQDNPIAFIDGLNNGTETFVGNEKFKQLCTWIDNEISYGINSTHTDFATEVASFTSGSAPMMFGGSYSQPSIDAVDANMNVGIYPFALTEDGAYNDYLYSYAAPIWHVNNAADKAAVAAAKDFLNWLAMEEEGQQWLGNGLKLVPCFTNFAVDENKIGVLGSTLKKYIDEGKIRGTYNALYPNGEGTAQILGEAVCKYAAGGYTVDEFLQAAQDIWTAN